MIVFSEAALGCFAVEERQVAAGFIHGGDDFVERHAVTAIGECREDVGVECSGGGEGITFDARNLHQAADRVASHAEVVLKSHLAGVFDLCHAASEELTGGTGSHSAGHSHFTLAPYFGARYRGVGFHDIANQSGGYQGALDAPVVEFVALVKMIQCCGQHSARAAGWRGDN